MCTTVNVETRHAKIVSGFKSAHRRARRKRRLPKIASVRKILSLMRQVCKICGNESENRQHMAKEMGFGLRETFEYLECGACGCVQLVQIPEEMARYYPPEYYSFQKHGRLKTFVRHKWSAFGLGRRSALGAFFSTLFAPNGSTQAIRRAGISNGARILDIGCGSGRLLLDLAYLGFTNLTGADPFIRQDLVYDNGVKVFKRPLLEMPGQFDLIMLHHSYEHMDRPAEAMVQVKRLLSPGGQIIIRIPVASSYAWREYGVNWVNLDAPRHFFLHTFRSIEILAGQAGLQVFQVVHEGNDEQFWASEQFARDIPSNDPRSLGASPIKRILHWPRIKAYKARAAELNRTGQGDLVCFHLRRAS